MNSNIISLALLGLLSFNSYMRQSPNDILRQEEDEEETGMSFPTNNSGSSTDQEFILPDIPPFNDFVSLKYKISFKYPNTWTKNPRYINKYSGSTGFFEVSDLSVPENNKLETIDEVAKAEINLPYKPYGSTPIIKKLTLDGQPARLIYPSKDQNKELSDRETALIVKYKTPLVIDGKTYPYVVIWSDKLHMPLIIKTFKFIE